MVMAARWTLGTLLATVAHVAAVSTCREPTQWPWAPSSIWNTPVGRSAQFHAIGVFNASRPQPKSFYGDEDIIVHVHAGDPQTAWYAQGWWGNPGGTAHCNITGTPLPLIAFPRDAIFDHWGHNNGAGIVSPDNQTVTQTQPLYRCSPGSPVFGLKPDEAWIGQDLVLGNGTRGAHGGSGLSAVGGTIRWWEIAPGGPGMRHALKIELSAAVYYYRAPNRSTCYRWPATACDGYALSNHSLAYNGSDPLLTPGALLAIPPGWNGINRTVPGGLIIKALREYGGYIVDDTACNRGTFTIEYGMYPKFLAAYGYDFKAHPGSPFYADLLDAFRALHVVANNAPESTGGGGGAPPGVSPPPPFCPPFDR